MLSSLLRLSRAAGRRAPLATHQDRTAQPAYLRHFASIPDLEDLQAATAVSSCKRTPIAAEAPSGSAAWPTGSQRHDLRENRVTELCTVGREQAA
jgi:hypothetical protein